MSTNYPGATDSFDVPSSPGTTPLSSAGSAARNHTTHHRDLGDAVVAIEMNAAQITHDHSGTGLNAPKLSQANTHQSVDTDNDPTSIHHTLGVGANQAAAGNHSHSNYLDLTTSQVVTGKKSFTGTGSANGVQIADFTNSNHDHRTAAGGGSIVTSKVSSVGAEAGHVSTFSGGTTTDFNLTAPFNLPANFAVMGTYFANVLWTLDPAGHGGGDTSVFISYNGGSGPVYVANNNIVAGNSDHYRSRLATPATFESFVTIAVPVYLPATTSVRNGIRISCRIIENGVDIRTSTHAFLGHFSN